MSKEKLLDDNSRVALEEKFKEALNEPVLIELVADDTRNADFTSFSRQFLTELCSLSEKLILKTMTPQDYNDESMPVTNTPDIFIGRDRGYKIEFLGAPAGYEVNSFIESLVLVSNQHSGFSESQLELLSCVSKPVLVESFVTTNCPHCPKSSVMNNRLAIARPGVIHSRTIESYENVDISREMDVSSVPQQVINRDKETITIGVQPEMRYIKQLLQLTCPDYEKKYKAWEEKMNASLPDHLDKPLPLNSFNFPSAIQKYPIILVDFWAEWCGPCKMVAPVLDELAREFNGRLTIGKVNIDEEGELAQKYGVQSIPTLILMRHGEIVETIVGFQSKKQLASLIQPHLQ